MGNSQGGVIKKHNWSAWSEPHNLHSRARREQTGNVSTTALCSPKRGGTKRAHSDNPVGICLSFGKTDGEQVLDGRQGQSATSNPCGRPFVTAFGQIL